MPRTNRVQQANEYELIVPKYMVTESIKNNQPHLSLINPLSKSRNIAKRRGQLAISIVQKDVSKPMLIHKGDMPVETYWMDKEDIDIIEGLDPADTPTEAKDKPVLEKVINKKRGRPVLMYKNLRFKKETLTRDEIEKMVRKVLKELGVEFDNLTDRRKAEITKQVIRRGEFNRDAPKEISEEEKNKVKRQEKKDRYKKEEEEQYFADMPSYYDKHKAVLEKETTTQRERYIIANLNHYEKMKKKETQGEGLYDTEFKNLLKSSYSGEPVEDWVMDKYLSTKTSKVYKHKRENKVVIAHRGTKGFADWGNNAVFALGGEAAYKLTPRYKEAKKVQARAEKKYKGAKISTIGHSQGSLQAEMLGKNTDETITLNKATRPQDLISRSKQNKNQYDISTKGDPVSVFRNPFEKYQKLDVKGSYNPIKAHSIDAVQETGQIFGDKSF